jgi:LmbE family N-acetylglucosaminyl deacetylase
MGEIVLVIAPHPDDESLGCGGSICLHRERGDRVHVVFLTSGELGMKHLPSSQSQLIREREAAAAAEILGVTELTFLRKMDWFVEDCIDETAGMLRPILEREVPGLIYLPHNAEWHPDHRAALDVVRSVLRCGTIPAPTLLTYEIWTPLSKYSHIEDITSTMGRKLEAIRCYSSQLATFRYDRAILGLNLYRGALTAHCRYAEVFQVLDPTSITVVSRE